jgi:hypothetical protein
MTLKAGTTATINVKPTYSPTANATIKRQFRVMAVLSGHKVIRGPT